MCVCFSIREIGFALVVSAGLSPMLLQRIATRSFSMCVCTCVCVGEGLGAHMLALMCYPGVMNGAGSPACQNIGGVMSR